MKDSKIYVIRTNKHTYLNTFHNLLSTPEHLVTRCLPFNPHHPITKSVKFHPHLVQVNV